MAKAQSPPDLGIPESKHTVTVSVIDTTARIVGSKSIFMGPAIKGADTLTACCYAFMINRDNPEAKSKYDTMIFDLGLRKDFMNSSKTTVSQIEASGWELSVEKNVFDILKDHGDDPAKVGGIIWSHWHLVRLPTSPTSSRRILTLYRTTQATRRPSLCQQT